MEQPQAQPQIEMSLFDPKYSKCFYDLNIQWISRYFEVEKKDIEQLENPEQCLADGGQIFFVLKDGLPVATCALYKEKEGVYELAKMAVSDECKGMGLSSKLMREIEMWVLANGGHEIYLLSNDSLAPAMGLYEKHGYKVFFRGSHPEYERANIGMRKKL
ncbi:MAG: GNAT family N-acetyltransferase [Bdellovibrionales bacterium]|nr:GNAT family N-acetyltransferase [Bdellovibrionales bacterium]